MTQSVSGTTNDLSRTFSYNLASQLQTRINATAAHTCSPPVANRGYAVNGRNQYTTVAGATHTHDLNGNLTSDGSRSFGYDAENRLTSVSGSQSLSLTYDPLGRLRQTTAGATTDFLYDGDRLIAEYNGATLLKRYAHGPGVDEPIVWYDGATLTTKRWLHPDERGSIVAWSDAAANATVYKYGAYGEPSNNDFSGSRFRYTGQIALPEVKLYHYKARVYDPYLGRFLQTDPVGYDDDFNLYAYVYNDPFNKTDPRGTETGAAFRSINCAANPATCGAYSQRIAEGVNQSANGIASSVRPVLQATEQAADVAGKSGETTTALVASTGIVTPVSNMADHRLIGAAVKGVGRATKVADAAEIGSQVLQGDVKGAAGSTINTGIGVGATMTAVAFGLNPPTAIVVGALAALGADFGDVGNRILSIEPPVLTEREMLMYAK